jgi:putative two-component system response regulator
VENKSAVPGAEGGGSEKARVLATDDRPDAFDLIERSLGEAYSCKFATEPRAALEMLEGQVFQLALCSVESPSSWGLGLIEKIVTTFPDTGVVVVAAIDDLRLVGHALRLGACGYVSKPLWSGQLTITVANALRQQQLKLASREAAELLAGAIEAHNPCARRHLARVASVAGLLGSKLGLDADRVAQLRAAAPMHDIGTIAVPGGVLRKRDRLTESERKHMETHTTVGHEILIDSESALLKMAAKIALTHHERFDGNGYPQGLLEGEIPIEGRIVAVADAFDALLSDKHHRQAFTAEEATQLIVQERRTHFDPDVVDALVENLDEALVLRGAAVEQLGDQLDKQADW